MKQTVVESEGVRLHLITPPCDLAPYISLYYVTEILPGYIAEDWLPPEGANLRAGQAAIYEACIGEGELETIPDTILAGPTSFAARVRLGEGWFPGIGLLPLGWAQFLDLPTNVYVDRVCALDSEPVPDEIKVLMRDLARSTQPPLAMAEAITVVFRSLLSRPVSHRATIEAVHAAIVSDECPSVASLANGLKTSTRTVERLCLRHFGFTPQLLLRRQRFLRSLAKFIIDPSMKWIDSLDGQYHDQAHFLRDFKRFMLMKPSEFAALPHPVASTAVAARRLTLVDPMQVLHNPARSSAVAI